MITRTLRGIGALAVVTVGLIGWPAALVTAGRAAGAWLPDLTDPLGLLARPDTGGLFLALVLALGAVAWLVWTVALLVEVAAQVRGVPTPRLGGLFPQHSAAALITAIAIAFSTTPAPASAGPVAPGGPVGPATSTSQTASPQPATQGPSGEGAARDYTVAPGDTLWGIADEQLDDPYSWPEIAAASAQITQPDGQHLADPDLIRPGWTLHIPAPTKAAAPPAQPPAAPAEPDPDQDGDGAATVDPPDTPLRPTAARTSGGGADRATAASVSGPAQPQPPATPLHPEAGDDQRILAWHGVAGLPEWVRPPFKPTRLADAPAVNAAVLAALAERGTP